MLNHSIRDTCQRLYPDSGKIRFRPPDAGDGVKLHRLIASCPPLDQNSVYCNLLQCTHFSETSVLAESADRLLGSLTAYRLPASPDCLFIWQIAVAAEARGRGLATRMIEELLQRNVCRAIRRLETTVNPDNIASEQLFTRLATRLGARLEKSVLFSREHHFAGAHPDEILLTLTSRTESFRDSQTRNEGVTHDLDHL